MLKSSGTTCAARGCTYNYAKLRIWRNSECFDHKPKTKAECSCPQWFKFHRLPKDEEAREMWLKNLNLKKPPKVLYLCSFHFVDKKPTDENPYPTLFLGSEDQPKKRPPSLRVGRQATKAKKLQENTTSEPESALEVSPAGAITKAPHNAKANQSMTEGVEQNYFKEPAIKKTRCISDVMLKDDACCLLYTGIPLQEFKNLVSCLHGFAATMSSTMSVEDQILLTLMNFRHNCDMADLASQFKTSELQACETLKYWTDITNSLVGWNLREKTQSKKEKHAQPSKKVLGARLEKSHEN